MTSSRFLLSATLLVLLAGCGKPPPTGGTPTGDFPVNVVGAPVAVTNLVDSVRLIGTFESPEVVRVVAEVPGKLISLGVDEGNKVEANQVLGRMDTRKLEARLAETKAQLVLTENVYKRSRKLASSQTISQQAYDEAYADFARAQAEEQLLEAELEDSVMKAPLAGIVSERMVSPGQVLQVGEHLFDVLQMDPLEVRFEVPERYSNLLKPGMTVRIQTEAHSETIFKGKLTYVSSQASRRTRTLPVKASVPNPDMKLVPGMFGRVELVLEEHNDALIVPEAAVMQRNAATSVMARGEDGRAAVRPVTVGLRLNGMMEILSGLQTNDVVVVEGLTKVRPGSLLAFSPESTRYGLDPAAYALAPPPSAEEGTPAEDDEAATPGEE